jgi:quercetin dioxygenase-like cupin family protein
MAERTRMRERETESEPSDTRLYEPKAYEYALDELDRAAHGKIVIKAKDRPWDMHRQANSKRYLSVHEPELKNTASHQWEVFLQAFTERSGKHRHQGGLVIFILEGSGYSIIDGVRHDWKAGDLTMLPLVPGGTEHQHFNGDPDRPVKWIAFIYHPFKDYAGSEMTQLENSPLYDKWMARLAEREQSFAADRKKS